ncbi:MAG TPA: hypothetical protein VK629_02110, partial [Steroidobacteraceae bacterium]|nr:hypothetical protein [Steroidobacteraceae bacterium]
QLAELSIDHQAQMPTVPPPESLKDVRDWLGTMGDKMPQGMRNVMMRDRPFEFRPVNADRISAQLESGPTASGSVKPEGILLQQWFKAADRLPDGEALHRCLLAYASDYYLLSACTIPHGIAIEQATLRVASIDHAMWFHRPVRVDEWLLYVVDSPSASGARGLARGSIFNQKGELVASTAQEGLFRRPSKPASWGTGH